jgi:hypothetical protein
MTADLDAILNGKAQAEPIAEVTESQPEQVEQDATEKPEQTRDEAGKFAKKIEPDPHAEQPEGDAEEQPEQRAKTVPQEALHAARQKEKAERERAEALERQLAEMRGQINLLAQQRQTPVQTKEPESPPDFWSSDPTDFISQNVTSAVTPLQQEVVAMRGALSRLNAVTSYGKDAVEDAEKALNEAVSSGVMPGDKVQEFLRNSQDPVGEIVRWHENTPQVQQAKLREQIRAELEAELRAEQATPAAPQTTPVMPSNLAGARNVGTRSGPQWAGPRPLNDILPARR